MIVERLNEFGRPVGDNFTAEPNPVGEWQVRALSDGRYRVLWDPPLRDRSLLAQTIPPAETIVLNERETTVAVTTTVQITGANRILDINFGIPDEGPIFGSRPIALPETGGGSGRSDMLLVLAGIALSLGAAGVLVLRARRA